MTKPMHRCPTCRWKHSEPRPSRAIRAFVQAAVFTVIEVLAALALGGWISIALWAIAAWNVVVIMFLVWGLANLATTSEEHR